MFDIGFWELVLCAVIALLVLGPERLPGAVRSLARWVRAVRATVNAVKNELSQELQLDELQKEFDAEKLHDDLHQAEQQAMQALTPRQQASLNQLQQAAAEVQRPYADAPATEPTTAAATTPSRPSKPATPPVDTPD